MSDIPQRAAALPSPARHGRCVPGPVRVAVPPSDPTPPPPAIALSQRLRARTAELHVRAERGGIVAAILAGTATRAGYALWLRNLLPAYQEMERALGRLRDRPGFGFLAQTALHRAERIAADLDAIAAPVRTLTLLPEGEDYARRIARAGDERLIAHAYTRYLGDLNGGRALRRRLLGLFGSDFPVSFSAFPEIADIGGFVAGFRAALDEAGARAADPDGVVEEAAVAFALNILLSEAILSAPLT